MDLGIRVARGAGGRCYGIVVNDCVVDLVLTVRGGRKGSMIQYLGEGCAMSWHSESAACI